MFVYESKVKVRYVETDQMGVVHHSNYAQYYELARTECFEACSGMSYEQMEAEGVMLPILEIQCKFLKPAYYNQILTIKSIVKEIPTVRLTVDYEIYNEDKVKITEASTTLFFLDAETNKIVRCPDFLLDLIKENWKE